MRQTGQWPKGAPLAISESQLRHLAAMGITGDIWLSFSHYKRKQIER